MWTLYDPPMDNLDKHLNYVTIQSLIYEHRNFCLSRSAHQHVTSRMHSDSSNGYLPCGRLRILPHSKGEHVHLFGIIFAYTGFFRHTEPYRSMRHCLKHSESVCVLLDRNMAEDFKKLIITSVIS